MNKFLQNLYNSFFTWFPEVGELNETSIADHLDEPQTAIDAVWNNVRQALGLPGTSPFFVDYEGTADDDDFYNYLVGDGSHPGLTDNLRNLPPDPSEGIPDSILPFVKTRAVLGDEYVDLPTPGLPDAVSQNGVFYSFWRGSGLDFLFQGLGSIYHTLLYWGHAWVDFIFSFFIAPVQSNLGQTQLITESIVDYPGFYTHVKQWSDPFYSWYAQELPDDFLENWLGFSPFLNGFFSSIHIFGLFTVGTLVSLTRLYTNGRPAWYVSTFGQVVAHYFLLCLMVYPIPQSEAIFSRLTPIVTFPIGLIFLLQSFLYLEETMHTVALDDTGRNPVCKISVVRLPRELDWKWSWDSIYTFKDTFIYSFVISLTIPMTVGIQGFTLLPQPSLTITNMSNVNFFTYTLGLILGGILTSYVIGLAFYRFGNAVTRWFYIYRSDNLDLPFGGNPNQSVSEMGPLRFLRLCTYTLALGVSFNSVACYANEQFLSGGIGFSSPNSNSILRSFWIRDEISISPMYEFDMEEQQYDWNEFYLQQDDDFQLFYLIQPYQIPYYDQWRDGMFDRPFLEDNFDDYYQYMVSRDRSPWRDEEQLAADKQWTFQQVELAAFVSEDVLARSFGQTPSQTQSYKALTSRLGDSTSVEGKGMNALDNLDPDLAPTGYFRYLLRSQKRRMLKRRQPPRLSRFEVLPSTKTQKSKDLLDRPNVGAAWLMDQQQTRAFENTAVDIRTGDGLNEQQIARHPKSRLNFLPKLDEVGRPGPESKSAGRFNRDGSFRLFADFPGVVPPEERFEVEERGPCPSPPINPGKRMCTRMMPEKLSSSTSKPTDKRVQKYKKKLRGKRGARRSYKKRNKALRQTRARQTADGNLIVEVDSTFNDKTLVGENGWAAFTNGTTKPKNDISYKRLSAKNKDLVRLMNPSYYVYDRLHDYDRTQDTLVRRDYIDMWTIKYGMKDGPVGIFHGGYFSFIDRAVSTALNPIGFVVNLATAVVKKTVVTTFDILTLNQRNRESSSEKEAREKAIAINAKRQAQRREKARFKRQTPKTNKFDQYTSQFFFETDPLNSSLFQRFDYERSLSELFEANEAYRFTFLDSYYKYPTTQLAIRFLADRLIRNTLLDPTVVSSEASKKITKNGASSLALEHAHERVIEYHNSMREYHNSIHSEDLGLIGSAPTKSYLNTPYRHQFKGRRSSVRRLTFTNRDEMENMMNADVLEYVKPVNRLPTFVDVNKDGKVQTTFGPSLHENVAYGIDFDKEDPDYLPWQELWRKAVLPEDTDFLPTYVSRDPQSGKMTLLPVVQNRSLNDYGTPIRTLSPENEDTKFISAYLIGDYFDPETPLSVARYYRDKLLALPIDSLDYLCFMVYLPESDPVKADFLKYLEKGHDDIKKNYEHIKPMLLDGVNLSNLLVRY